MMLFFTLLAAAGTPDAPRPACATRQMHVPAGKLNHAAQAVTCTSAAPKMTRESRVVRPRMKT